eukprot:jgi/Picre1/28819/NNA_004216.t1
MTATFSPISLSGIQNRTQDDHGLEGVIGALESICELESRLRQAIQQTHPLSTSLDWDFEAADRERKALLSISQQLEYLEDKLRELRFVASGDGEQKGILLGQLDSVRRELLEITRANVDRVLYAKDLVKDILLFAAGEEEADMLATPGRRTNFSSAQETPKGKRTPVVPESLEIDDKRWNGRFTGDAGQTRLDTKGSSPSKWSEEEMRTSQRKYSTFSRTLMVTDEDIYGPKPTNSTPNSQRYGGTVKVKELLAKAEEGLSTVVEAQSQRRTAPRVLDEDTAMGGSFANEWDEIESFEGPTIALPSGGVQRDVTSWSQPRGLISISPESKDKRSTPLRSGGYDEARRRIEPHLHSGSSNGIVVTVTKIAGLAMMLGGVAAAIVAVSIAANSNHTAPRKRKTTKKTRQKKSYTKKSHAFRGEADVPTLQDPEDAVVFEERVEWSDDHDDQPPVMNVHRPPSSQNFPANPPDVSVAMG